MRIRNFTRAIILKVMDVLKLRCLVHYLKNNFPIYIRLYKIMRRSSSATKELKQISKKDKPRVLFMHMRGAPYLLIFEAFLAWRLRFERAETIFLACEDLPICNNRTPGSSSRRQLCKYCLRTNVSFCKIFNLPLIRLSSLLDNESYKRSGELTGTLSHEQCMDFVYRDIPLGKLCEPSVARYLLQDAREASDPLSLKVWRDFLASGIILVDAYEKLFEKIQPDIVSVCNGLFFWYSIAQEMANRRGIRVVLYENAIGHLPDGGLWTFREDSNLADFVDAPTWKKWQNVPLIEEETEILNRWMSFRRRGSIFHPDPIEDVQQLREQLNLPSEEQPVVSMFSNVGWDANLAGRRHIFRSVKEWAIETIHFCGQQDFTVVLRIHPAEALLHEGQRNREYLLDSLMDYFKVLPPNVRVIPPESKLSSYTLLELSKAVLVYSSTIGLETSVEGRWPVIIAGRAQYANRGFGYYPTSREQYFELLSNIENLEGPSESEIELARRYLFMSYFRYNIPLRFFDISGWYQIKNFKIYELDELRPGRNPYLDFIADGVLRTGNFVLSRELLKPKLSEFMISQERGKEIKDLVKPAGDNGN